MKLELKERDTLIGAAIKGDVVITMSPGSIVMGCRFEGDVVLKTTETRGKITFDIPKFWQNYIIGHFTFDKKYGSLREISIASNNKGVWIRENVTVREEDLTEAGKHNAKRYEAVVREFRQRVDEGFRATMKEAGVSEERIQEFYRNREKRR